MKKLLAVLLFPIACVAQCWDKYDIGYNHSIAIAQNGQMFGWGYNGFGQLGNGNNSSTSFPLPSSSQTFWEKISGGGNHTAAIKTDGTLWVFGRNGSGELGVSGGNTNIPIQYDSATDWLEVFAGSFNTFAIKEDGTLWSWGLNFYGQLGHPTSSTNRQVGTDSDWLFVSPTPNFTLALKTDGTLWGWGRNVYGELGNGNALQQNTPVEVLGNMTWISAAGGIENSVAVRDDGTLWTWGSNADFQLGIVNSTGSYVPVQVGTDNNWLKVGSGEKHCTALKTDGTLWSWGRNNYSQLGVPGSSVIRDVPTQIGTDTDWINLIVTGENNIAEKADGTLWLWGRNDFGQLGSNPTNNGPRKVICPTLDLEETTTQKLGLSIHPIPADDYLYVNDSEEIGISIITIMDLNGRVLLNSSANANKINIESLSAGIYLCKIASMNGKLTTFKFTKK